MKSTNSSNTLVPNPKSRKMIEDMSGQKISACFQCEKCTNGCPVTFAMDIVPHKLIHLLHYGQLDDILRSRTIWLCASCETCTARCPNGIDIAHIMDTLRQLSKRQGIKASQRAVPIFHTAFLSSIQRYGRVNEAEMVVNYSIKDRGLPGLFKLTGQGLGMFFKGKVKLMPHRVRRISTVRNLFKKAEVKPS